VVDQSQAALAAHQQVELAQRKLKVWAGAVGVTRRTEGWVVTGDGTFGAWMPLPESPDELVEQTYPLRLLTPPAGDPDHAAHDGTIYYGLVPTASDQVTADSTARFSDRDVYEIVAYVRPDRGPCPGPLLWSAPSETFRLASFFDPAGCAQRPIDVQLPDFTQLEASNALPSVKMTQPPGSSLEFSKFGDIPKKGKVGADFEICFFSIPLITIIAMFVLNLFLPIVMFVFQLWWMLKLKFCIPPSIEFEGELAAALDVTPPEIELAASLDVDVLPGVNQAELTALLGSVFNPPPPDPLLDPVPPEWRLGDKLGDSFTSDPLVELLARQGYGRASSGGAPAFAVPVQHTTPVRRDEVVHP
jgi:hypothetical protein